MPKIRICESDGKPFFLDKRGQVIKPKRGRPPRERFCDGCGGSMGKCSGHVCLTCWTACKIFRRYLREVLRLEPIKDDHPPERTDAERFAGFGGVAFGETG